MLFSKALQMAVAATTAVALSLDLTDKDSVCAAAKEIVIGEFNYYEGTRYGGTVGMFTPPYYWWHAGEAFGGILIYYTYCDSDNTTLRDVLFDAMYHQAGEQFNYIPSNQSLTEGNDDQGVWGMAIMEAAERNFTESSEHSWIELSQAVFNTMAQRWDPNTCNGGLRWQIFTWNSGYDYKNTISNGLLFHMGARLARYLDNETYADTAEKAWNWMEDVGFLYRDGENLLIYDGANVPNCTDVTKLLWSYSYGVLMSGCAYMYNYTSDETWKERAIELANEGKAYFVDSSGIMQETTCAPSGRCNNDQRSFRSLYSRGIGHTMTFIPEVQELMSSYMEKSAQGAAQSCSGGSDGITCGQDWSYDGWDDKYGLGEQMSALEAILANKMPEMHVPYSIQTGGSNKTNSQAGLDTKEHINKNELNITGKDRTGAGILTAVVLAIVLGGGIWMVL